jgi:hypothetical protein
LTLVKKQFFMGAERREHRWVGAHQVYDASELVGPGEPYLTKTWPSSLFMLPVMIVTPGGVHSDGFYLLSAFVGRNQVFNGTMAMGLFSDHKENLSRNFVFPPLQINERVSLLIQNDNKHSRPAPHFMVIFDVEVEGP